MSVSEAKHDEDAGSEGSQTETVVKEAEISGPKVVNIRQICKGDYVEAYKRVMRIDDKKNPYLFLDNASIAYANRTDAFQFPKPLDKEVFDNLTDVEKCLIDSKFRLEQCFELGRNLIDNVRIGTENRERERKIFDDTATETLIAKIRGASIQANAELKNIQASWSELKLINEPVLISEAFEKQKQEIAALMQRRDDVIEDCQQQIDRINDQFKMLEEAQINDICTMVFRVKRNIDMARCIYTTYEDMLTDTIESERQTLYIAKKAKWDQFCATVQDMQDRIYKEGDKKEELYKHELQAVERDQEEITRATRIRLEKQYEKLQWELRNKKNEFFINFDKMDYNYQILQQRCDENQIIINQQKRRIAHCKEQMHQTRLNMQRNELADKAKMEKINTLIDKLHSSSSELEQKAVQFRKSNKIKFDRVWEVHWREMTTLLNKIFDIDRILYEQQLGLKWKSPEVDWININSDQVKNKKTAHGAAFFKDHRKSTDKILERKLLRSILAHISDRGGFLIEEELLKILAPFTENDQCLVRVGNIFSALKIDDHKLTDSLIKYFLPFSWCPNCSHVPPEALELLCANPDALERLKEKNLLKRQQDEKSVGKRKSRVSVIFEKKEPPKIIKNRISEYIEKLTSDYKKIDCPDHYLVTDPALVLTALNRFTGQRFNKRLSADGKGIGPNVSIKFDKMTVHNFWSKFENYVPPEKIKVWRTMEHGLNHYLSVLKDRVQLETECAALARQNYELKHFLQNY